MLPRQQHLLKKIDSYCFNQSEVLGQGSFSTVYRGVDTLTNRPVAIKTVSTQGVKEDDRRLEMLRKEVKHLQLIDHDNVVRVIDFKKSSSNLYLIMEYCNGGNLETLLQHNHGRLVEEDALKIFKNLVDGMKQLFENQMVHRDIKPANVLIHNFQAKIADFGFSRLIDDQQQQLNSLVGTPLYMSPQLLNGEAYTSKTDIWSLGIVLYQMLYGKTPFSGSDSRQLYKAIQWQQKPNFPETPRVSHALQELLMRMLAVEEELRISWEQLFNSELLSDKFEQQIKTSLELVNNSDGFDQLAKIKGLIKLFLLQNKVVTSSYECLRKEIVIQLILKEHLSQTANQEDEDFKALAKTFNGPNDNPKPITDAEIKQLFDFHRMQQENFTLLTQMSSYILHRRNKAVFFYLAAIQVRIECQYVTMQIYELYNEANDMKEFEFHLVVRLIFLVLKYSVLKLFRLYKRLKSNQPQKFNKFSQKQWEVFMKSEQRTHLLKFISSNFEIGQLFFDRFTQFCKVRLVGLRDQVQSELQGSTKQQQQQQQQSEMENDGSEEFICLQPPSLMLQSFEHMFGDMLETYSGSNSSSNEEIVSMISAFLPHCSKKVRPKEQFTQLLQSTIQLGLGELYFRKNPSRDLLQVFFKVKLLLPEWRAYTHRSNTDDIWSKFYEHIDALTQEQLYHKLIGLK